MVDSPKYDIVLILDNLFTHSTSDRQILKVEFVVASRHNGRKHLVAIHLPKSATLFIYHNDSIICDSIAIEEGQLNQLIPLWIEDLRISHQPMQ